MRTLYLIAALLLLTAITAAEPVHPTLPFDLKDLKLVDEIDFSNEAPGHDFAQLPNNAVSYETILKRKAMVLANTSGSSNCYASFVLGKGKGLQGGKAYVLVVDYPEDEPRSVIVRNHGAEITRGFHTGLSLGDGLEIPYVYSHPESINYPLSKEWKQWVSVFHLHDHFSDVKMIRGKGTRQYTPKDGFHVAIARFDHKDDPVSKGPAIGRIALYEAPDHAEIKCELVLPPEELPQRYLFYREEMADGVISKRDGRQAGLDEQKDWFEYHARLMNFLGINTFSKDLLEFGANQGWSPEKYGGYKWMHSYPPAERIWSDIIDLAVEYDLNVLPYYEYCGTKGPNGHGNQKRCRTLHQAKKGPKGRDDYTHISWTEPHNADVTDPETYEDLKKILDCTITPFSGKANFVGAWIRTRSSQLPISFSDRCLGLYAQDTGAAQPTRQDLINDKAKYEDYLNWWYGKRKEFLIAMRDFVQGEAGVKDGIILFTADASEGGTGIGKKGVVTDTPSAWNTSTIPFADVVAQGLSAKTQKAMRGTWGGWEWQHSVPPADPQRYTDTDGIVMSYGFNRQYTVSNPNDLEQFRTPSGLGIIRHYVLNENALGKKNPLGYFVCDFDVAGPYNKLAEARALANGDPRYIGYLASAVYTSGFAEYARAFNQAFLSLPAVPSTVLGSAVTDKNVVVREYKTDKHGTWYAVINIGMEDVIDVDIKLAKTKNLVNAITKEKVKSKSNKVRVSLYPGQVITWHAEM